MPNAPEFPAGPAPTEPVASEDALRVHVESLAHAPALFRTALNQLTSAQLDTPYRNWTPRQIVHHVADSHTNSYLRFKLALTEDNPTVRPYDENVWANLPDARSAPIDAPLALIDGVHAAWLGLLATMTWSDYQRTFYHPELDETVPLTLAIAYYPWHARHHTAQIDWLAANRT